MADLVAEGAECWREAADAVADIAATLGQAGGELGGDAAHERLSTSTLRLAANLKVTAQRFDGMADRFSEAAAGLQSYRRDKAR